jgi:hypothetical protein
MLHLTSRGFSLRLKDGEWIKLVGEMVDLFGELRSIP